MMEVNVPLLARRGRDAREVIEPLLRSGYELRRPGMRGRLAPARADRLEQAPWGAALGRRRPHSAGLHAMRGLFGRSGLVNLVALRPGAAGATRRSSGRGPAPPAPRSP